MKEKTQHASGCLAALLVLFLFAGCANQEKQIAIDTTTTNVPDATDQSGVSLPEKQVTSTAASTTLKESETPDTTVPAEKGLNESCALDSDCASRCCAYINGKHKCSDSEACKPKEITEEECYSKQMNWCAGKCQRGACENCTKYSRCIVSTENGIRTVLVETAEKSKEKEGSCSYYGSIQTASGEDGYCGQHKGAMIYAKCGSAPEAKDCASAYGNPSGYTYRIMNQRAFHAPGGEEYDLWCFLCERAG
jgi:hypothetical protein